MDYHNPSLVLSERLQYSASVWSCHCVGMKMESHGHCILLALLLVSNGMFVSSLPLSSLIMSLSLWMVSLITAGPQSVGFYSVVG